MRIYAIEHLAVDVLRITQRRIALLIARKALTVVRDALDIYRMYPDCKGSLAWATADLYTQFANILVELAIAIGGHLFDLDDP